MTREQVIERVAKHYDAAEKKYGADAILGVFLYGSQNYQCDIDSSDVDTKCILIPDIYHLACEPYSVKHLDVDGEVCECMSIQHIVENWKKQNPNFLEILWTDYCIINPAYEAQFIRFKGAYRDRLAHYNMIKGIKSIAGQALHTLRQDPMNPKKVANGWRLYYLLLAYRGGNAYDECLVPPEEIRAKVRGLKSGRLQPEEQEARILIADFESFLQEDYDFPIDGGLNAPLNDFICKMIYRREDLKILDKSN